MSTEILSDTDSSGARRKLARASLLALCESVWARGSQRTETCRFLVLPKTESISYEQAVDALVSRVVPCVLFCFLMEGHLAIGSWNAAEAPQEFHRVCTGREANLRAAGENHGRGNKSNFLVAWGGDRQLISMNEALQWQAIYQLAFCIWRAKDATSEDREHGADVRLSFERPDDDQRVLPSAVMS